MIRRFKVGYDVGQHKRTLESSLLSLVGPRAVELATKAFALADDQLPTNEHNHALSTLGQTPIRLIRTDLGFDVLFEATARQRSPRSPVGRRRRAGRRGRGRDRARRARPSPLRDRSRRVHDPPRGRPQRACRQLHEGVLRGPRDGRKTPLQGQTQPPPAGLLLSEPVEPGAELSADPGSAGPQKAAGALWAAWAAQSSPPPSVRSACLDTPRGRARGDPQRPARAASRRE